MPLGWWLGQGSAAGELLLLDRGHEPARRGRGIANHRLGVGDRQVVDVRGLLARLWPWAPDGTSELAADERSGLDLVKVRGRRRA
jgi:hypothetical protein